MQKPLPDDFNVLKKDIEWHQYVNTQIQNYDDSFWTIKALKTSEGGGSAIGMCIMFFFLIPLFVVFLIYNESSYSKVKSIANTARWNNVQQYLDTVSQYNSSVDIIVSDYADFIHEHYRPDSIWDVAKLPHPKDKIMEALIHFHVKDTTSEEKRKASAVLFIYLSQFQEGVGDKELNMALDRLKKLTDDHRSGEINDAQLQKLMKVELEKVEEDKAVYDKFNVLVLKEMNESLPKKLTEGIAKAQLEKLKKITRLI
jgi:hypothetical protein